MPQLARVLSPEDLRRREPGSQLDLTPYLGLLETVRRKSSELLGRSEASGLLLLADLRSLYLSAQEAEITWVILLQAAKAVRDRDLLETATSCQHEAETRGKWLRTRIKEASPQVLATG